MSHSTLRSDIEKAAKKVGGAKKPKAKKFKSRSKKTAVGDSATGIGGAAGG